MQFSVANRRRADHELAIGHRFGHAVVLFRVLRHVGGAHGGPRFAKSRVVRIHHPQAGKAEVAHRARGRADVERIVRRHQDNAQAVETGRSGQGAFILCHHGTKMTRSSLLVTGLVFKDNAHLALATVPKPNVLYFPRGSINARV